MTKNIDFRAALARGAAEARKAISLRDEDDTKRPEDEEDDEDGVSTDEDEGDEDDGDDAGGDKKDDEDGRKRGARSIRSSSGARVRSSARASLTNLREHRRESERADTRRLNEAVGRENGKAEARKLLRDTGAVVGKGRLT